MAYVYGENAGIGTDSPSSPAGGTDIVDITGATPTLVWHDSGDQTWGMFGNSGRLTLYGGADGVHAFTSLGTYTGIGTYTPEHTFDIHGTADAIVRINATTNNQASLYFAENGSTKWNMHNLASDDSLRFKVGSDDHVVFTADGKVGIGTTAPGYNLEVAGTFYSGGSSIDYKKHVTDLDVDTSLIHSLRPVSYNYKKEYKDFGYNVKDGKQIGLVSEEVAKTIPELAIMKDGKPKNVDYQKLAVVLLAEVQSLKKDIEELKKDN